MNSHLFNVLLSFVGFHDPYSRGLVGEQDQPGPILSLLEARKFNKVVLFATPNTDRLTDETSNAVNPNRKIFEARKRETAALGAGEKLVLGHPLAATIGDSARCMQNLEKVLFTGPKTSDTVTFICD